ncbi:MAG: hypothetical protein ACXW2I_06735, partial [Burkholderiales bacterium]
MVTVFQCGTDIQFLRLLARRNGYECYVELDPAGGQPVGHFHPPRYSAATQGVLSVGMGAESTVDKLTVRFDMLRPAATRVSNSDVDAGNDQTAEITSV